MDQQHTRTLISLSTAYYCLLLLFITPKAFAATEFILPPNYHSIYAVYKYGTDVGKMHNELNYKDGSIRYSSRAVASGIASLFVKDDLLETSILKWPENKSLAIPQQQSYDLFRGEKHKKNQLITFNWKESGAVNINGSYKRKSYNISTEQPVWSRHFIPLLMSSDLQLDESKSTNNYLITDKGKLQNYTYTLENTEDIKFSGKLYPCLKFKVNRQGSKRMSYVWLSREHYFIPLKIEQYKNGDLNASMLLKQLKTEQ